MMFKKIFTILLSLIYLASIKADLCEDVTIDKYITYAAEGQPEYITCQLKYCLDEDDINVLWYKNGSQTQITSDQQSRVHQIGNNLNFFPTKLEDTDFYSCVFRNDTLYVQETKKLEVYKFEEGLCYNKSTMYSMTSDGTSNNVLIHCAKLEAYLRYKNVQIKWFKECQPLDLSNNRYDALGASLYIQNVTQQDEGIYTCEASFEYNATEFTISQSTEFTFLVPPKTVYPAILIPTNNVMDVELGSSISLVCKMTYSGGINSIFWSYNSVPIDEYYQYDSRVAVEETQTTRTQDGLIMVTKCLNISQVKEEDYYKQFYCEVAPFTNSKAYVILKYPDPNFQGFLIAFFVSMVLTIVIVILTIKIFKVDIVLWYRGSCFAQTKTKDGKIYDAYIMYPKNASGNGSYTMDIFVLKVLPEVLERQCTYRLFIFGRDDLPGHAVTDLIDEIISKSRRLVIVLGNTTSEDGDGFEQQIAMYDALIRNKLKVILIELEKISDYTNMPESIKYIKQKQGVVQWKGDFTKAALSPKTKFWKNIRYRMPPTQGQCLQELSYISLDHL
ncbi:interleukin-1 receptor type 1-like isoform 2-T2 [Discoglossus pictus]